MLVQRNQYWDEVADIIVVGCGGAGAIAALTAHDAGADVLVVEKQSSHQHYTNTGMSGATFIAPTDSKSFFRYMEQLHILSGDTSPLDNDVLRVWVEYASHNKEWVEKELKKKVIPFGTTGYAPVPGWESMTAYHYRGWGWGFFNDLRQQMHNRKIQIMYNAPAEYLLTNSKGKVIGLRAKAHNGDETRNVNIRARKAVILTCGGFQFNEQLKAHHLKVYPFYGHGTPANTGDGVRMAVEVGADLWHMNYCSGRLMAKFPDFPIAFSMDFSGKGAIIKRVMGKTAGHGKVCPYLITDRNGRRYLNEETMRHHWSCYDMAQFDSQRIEYPRLPSYWIFDQKRIDDGELPMLIAGAAGPYRLYKWSRDNSKEIERGWIASGETVQELAHKIHIDADTLSNTVKVFNSYCEQGEDPEFHRDPASLVALRNPPYYAVTLWPGGPTTHGGPRRNSRAQILNLDGNPIPGLYGAGELGSIFNMLYVGGGGLIGECIAFGRIAAENALRGSE